MQINCPYKKNNNHNTHYAPGPDLSALRILIYHNPEVGAKVMPL